MGNSRSWHPLTLQKPPSDITGVIGKSAARAIIAVHDGVASEEQQKQAFLAIITNVCGHHDLSYRPDEMGGERDTAFAEGKRYVATQLMKLVNRQDLLEKVKD